MLWNFGIVACLYSSEGALRFIVHCAYIPCQILSVVLTVFTQQRKRNPYPPIIVQIREGVYQVFFIARGTIVLVELTGEVAENCEMLEHQ
jgi:hypothetical protein